MAGEDAGEENSSSTSEESERSVSVGMPSRPSDSGREALEGGGAETSSSPRAGWSRRTKHGGERDAGVDEASARDIE